MDAGTMISLSVIGLIGGLTGSYMGQALHDKRYKDAAGTVLVGSLSLYLLATYVLP
jgi:hypothetical protein